PRLIGIRRALDMILKGYSIPAAEAERIGLVDGVLPWASFLEAARAETRRVVKSGRVRRRSLEYRDRLLATVGPVRDLYFRLAERRVKQETRGQYPAPEAAIGALRE